MQAPYLLHSNHTCRSQVCNHLPYGNLFSIDEYRKSSVSRHVGILNLYAVYKHSAMCIPLAVVVNWYSTPEMFRSLQFLRVRRDTKASTSMDGK
jgi:hypothetical protein